MLTYLEEFHHLVMIIYLCFSYTHLMNNYLLREKNEQEDIKVSLRLESGFQKHEISCGFI